MKIQSILLALTLALPPLSQASTKFNCAFGENTADLSDQLDQDSGKGKVWYKGETISVSSPPRIKGLTAFERNLILAANGESESSTAQAKNEALLNFVHAEGYIIYFSHGSNDREFVKVGSYPGDNEFGLVFEIERANPKSEFQVKDVAAIISDGDLEDCKVEKE